MSKCFITRKDNICNLYKKELFVFLCFYAFHSLKANAILLCGQYEKRHIG